MRGQKTLCNSGFNFENFDCCSKFLQIIKAKFTKLVKISLLKYLHTEGIKFLVIPCVSNYLFIIVLFLFSDKIKDDVAEGMLI